MSTRVRSSIYLRERTRAANAEKRGGPRRAPEATRDTDGPRR